MLESARAQLWLRRAFFLAAAFALVMALLPHPPRVPLNPGDKLLHMLAFATLGSLAATGWRQRSWPSLFFALALFGAFIEIAQAIPALHRDSQWSDWFADMAAALAAIGAARGILR